MHNLYNPYLFTTIVTDKQTTNKSSLRHSFTAARTVYCKQNKCVDHNHARPHSHRGENQNRSRILLDNKKLTQRQPGDQPGIRLLTLTYEEVQMPSKNFSASSALRKSFGFPSTSTFRVHGYTREYLQPAPRSFFFIVSNCLRRLTRSALKSG